MSDTATVSIAVTGVERLGGADRYAVSAATSARTFPPGSTGMPGVPVAYIASGELFSDALSASARAGTAGGPVLLTAKDTVPRAIRDELTRLKPAKIIVVGGLNTISKAVSDALAPFAPSVERIDGADRFEVSARLSSSFVTPRPVAYVASGAVFPDALSGSAAAGLLGGPVLLTSKDAVPATVMAELTRLQPSRVVVLGGTNTVADSVVTQLATIRVGGMPPSVVRVAGADRFEVSAQASTEFPQNNETAYIASGTVFPDALSGSAAAIQHKAPVLLVTSDGIPTEIDRQLKRLNPVRIVVLGGPNTVSAAVFTQLATYLRH